MGKVRIDASGPAFVFGDFLFARIGGNYRAITASAEAHKNSPIILVGKSYKKGQYGTDEVTTYTIGANDVDMAIGHAFNHGYALISYAIFEKIL